MYYFEHTPANLETGQSETLALVARNEDAMRIARRDLVSFAIRRYSCQEIDPAKVNDVVYNISSLALAPADSMPVGLFKELISDCDKFLIVDKETGLAA